MAEMPELGQLPGEQVAALSGLAPIAHDSGAVRGKCHWRRMAPAATRSYPGNPRRQPSQPVLKIFADRFRDAGKPHKVVMTTIARKLVTIANTLCKRLKWTNQVT
ncbi:hypothetical protein [Phyllobacterium sp. SB3]|uniref:hypothetical protein n=1 Tax=Phyllobacterium sp. SB3 TaxID=3156073 RepID=UPI0032B005D6